MPRHHRSRRSALMAVLAGFAGLAVVVAVFVPFRDDLGSTPPALVALVVVVACAVYGGAVAAIVVSVAATVALNLAFIQPYGSMHVAAIEGVVVLVVFLMVAIASSLVVDDLERRRAQAEEREADLRVANESLASMQAERVVLAQQADRAEDLEYKELQRTALLRSVSHDLRTPLSAIRAVATDLRDGVIYDDDTRRELLETVCDEVDRLDRLVANLLSLSRIEAGAFTPHRRAVDVAEMVDDRFEKLAPLLRHVSPRVGIPADLPMIDADFAQLEQVFTNLLANAARHAPKDSDLWVVARVDGPDEVRVEVSDHGPGFADDDGEHVFEAFHAGEGSRSTGVGLAICRAIVEAHDGRIWIERSFGGGATVAFTMPIHQAVRPATADVSGERT